MLCRHPPLGFWGEVVQLFFHSAGGWVGACHHARAIGAQDLNIELGERGRHTDNNREHNEAPKGNSSKWCNFSSIDGTLPTCNCQTKSLRGGKLTHSNRDKPTTPYPFKLSTLQAPQPSSTVARAGAAVAASQQQLPVAVPLAIRHLPLDKRNANANIATLG